LSPAKLRGGISLYVYVCMCECNTMTFESLDARRQNETKLFSDHVYT